MDNRDEIRDFLVSRRAKITPAQAGLPAYGHGRRRVAGLRREEVALLAGVSVDYYTKLERGQLRGVSLSVLEGLVSALQLDDAERAHLHDLARAATGAAPRVRRRGVPTVRPSVQRTLDAITAAPAYVRNARRDVLAVNRLGRALYSELYADIPTGPANIARFVFLSPRARTYFLNWDRSADDVVATLRTEAGRHPHDKDLSDLIGELATRSEEFSTRWASHDVRFHRSGTKAIHHPAVGDLHLSFEAMELPADPGLALIVYSAEPGSSSADGLVLLASWAATLDLPADTDTHADAGSTSVDHP